MNPELWRRLVVWEVRHALRGATFWVMALLAVALPLAAPCVLAGHAGLRAGLPVAQVVLLCALVSLWTVFAVKRLLASNVSDDWLLVFTYREALASRFLAGLVVGGLMAALSATAAAAVLSWDAWWASQPVVLLSILGAAAVAAVVVAAADFLVSPMPVVLFAQLVLSALWCLLPMVGFTWPVAKLTGDADAAVMGSLLLGSALALNLLVLSFGWYRAEDFWAYLRVALRERDQASLGSVRAVVKAAEQSAQGSQRQERARLRAAYRARGLEPLQAHEWARFPIVRLPREMSVHGRWQLGVVALVALALVACRSALTGESFRLYVVYFAWYIAAAALVLRTLVSGAQIVAQETEQGTLPGLLVTPLGAGRILTMKLLTVLRQALPWLVGLTFVMRWQISGDCMDTFLWITVLTAAVCGVMASAWFSSRLLATVLGGLMTLAVMAAEGLALNAVPGALHARAVILLAQGGLISLVLFGAAAAGIGWLLFNLLKPLSVRCMFAQATAR